MEQSIQSSQPSLGIPVKRQAMLFDPSNTISDRPSYIPLEEIVSTLDYSNKRYIYHGVNEGVAVYSTMEVEPFSNDVFYPFKQPIKPSASIAIDKVRPKCDNTTNVKCGAQGLLFYREKRIWKCGICGKETRVTDDQLIAIKREEQ